MASIGTVKIALGVDATPLVTQMAAATSSFAGSIGRMKKSAFNLARSFSDNSANIESGLLRVSDATKGLSGGISDLANKGAFLVSSVSGLQNSFVGFKNVATSSLASVATMLPKLSGGIMLLMGPIGIVAGAIAGLAYMAVNHFDLMVKVIAKVANWFIRAYNDSLLFRGSIESIKFAFKSLITIAKAVFDIVTNLFSTIWKAGKAFLSWDFGEMAMAIDEGISKHKAALKESGEKIGKYYWEGIMNTFAPERVPPLSEESIAAWLKNLVPSFFNLFKEVSRKVQKIELLPTLKATDPVTFEPIAIKVEDQFSEVFQKLRDSLNMASRQFQVFGDKSEYLADQQLAIKSAINELLKSGIDPLDGRILDLTRRYRELQQESNTVDFGGKMLTDMAAAIQGMDFSNVGMAKENVRELNSQLLQNKAILTDPEATEAQKKAAQTEIKLLNERIQQEKERGNVALQVAKVVADTARQNIKAALSEAIGLAIRNAVASGPLGIFLAAAAAAAVGVLFDQLIPAFADGGLVFGPTLGMVGEYPGARSNPEVIAPLSKLKSMLGDSVGSGNIVATGIVRGEDLQILLERASSHRQTSAGF